MGVPELPPLALYIHLPWCIKKCPYCDFNSHQVDRAVPERRYAAALVADLEYDLPYVQQRVIGSIYFGGGTPSLFSATAVAAIIAAIRARIPLSTDVEISLEANPGTVGGEALAGYLAAGVNRLSLGLQSLRDAALQRIGRIHDARAGLESYAQARTAGFKNINVDLMYALPADTIDGARQDIEAVCVQQPQHVSWYQLTVEPNTEFARRPPQLPDNDTAWGMYRQGRQILAENGYRQYEISAYARPGYEARHNLNYWRFGDYLGIGAGAKGKITLPDGIVRTAKPTSPASYMRHAGSDSGRRLQALTTGPDLVLEFVLNALRLRDGFDAALFERHTRMPFSVLRPRLAAAIDSGFIADNPARVRLTELGWRFLDNCLLLFVDDTADKLAG